MGTSVNGTHDLMKNIANIASSNNFDYIIIESTGISEPQQVAETFAAPADMLLDQNDNPNELESLHLLVSLDWIHA
jgi:G3E family GTPase